MKTSPTAVKASERPAGAGQKLAARFHSGLDAIFHSAPWPSPARPKRPVPWGREVIENLAPLGGRMFPVNPKRATVLGRKVFPDIAAAPEPVDLVAIVTPAATSLRDIFVFNMCPVTEPAAHRLRVASTIQSLVGVFIDD